MDHETLAGVGAKIFRRGPTPAEVGVISLLHPGRARGQKVLSGSGPARGLSEKFLVGVKVRADPGRKTLQGPTKLNTPIVV